MTNVSCIHINQIHQKRNIIVSSEKKFSLQLFQNQKKRLLKPLHNIFHRSPQNTMSFYSYM